jgi:hypothetical protein
MAAAPDADHPLMRWPPPTARVMLALHVAAPLPLLALAICFGTIGGLARDDRRCGSCGVEAWVIAAFVAAALWLAAVVAVTSATRRQARGEGAGPGRRTRRALAAAGLFATAAIAWHPLFDVPALVAMVASVVVAPVAVVWWLLRTAGWLRARPRPEQLGESLAAAWVDLAFLLPALFGFVWATRVEWLVF